MSTYRESYERVNTLLWTAEAPAYGDVVDALTELAARVESAEDVSWDHGEFELADLAAVIVGAFWHSVDCHGGMWSDVYALQCALGRIYTPGMMECGPGDDTSEAEVYAQLLELAGLTEER